MLTPDDIKNAYQDYEAGVAIEVIAGQLNLEKAVLHRAFDKYKQEITEMTKPTKRKPRIDLSGVQRQEVARLYREGKKSGDIAKRFNITDATVRRISRTTALTPAEPSAPEPEKLGSIEGVYLEGDFVVIKIPKKEFTRSLLKDFI